MKGTAVIPLNPIRTLVPKLYLMRFALFIIRDLKEILFEGKLRIVGEGGMDIVLFISYIMSLPTTQGDIEGFFGGTFFFLLDREFAPQFVSHGQPLHGSASRKQHRKRFQIIHIMNAFVNASNNAIAVKRHAFFAKNLLCKIQVF